MVPQHILSLWDFFCLTDGKFPQSISHMHVSYFFLDLLNLSVFWLIADSCSVMCFCKYIYMNLQKTKLHTFHVICIIHNLQAMDISKNPTASHPLTLWTTTVHGKVCNKIMAWHHIDYMWLDYARHPSITPQPITCKDKSQWCQLWTFSHQLMNQPDFSSCSFIGYLVWYFAQLVVNAQQGPHVCQGHTLTVAKVNKVHQDLLVGLMG